MKSRLIHALKKYATTSQRGFISTNLRKLMSRNEKIIMGFLIGGILIFLVLSVILLFSKNENISSVVPPSTIKDGDRVNTTPYPTIPPIEDMTVMINERRLNPPTVTIKSGNMVSFFNIGVNSITVEGADANSSFLNFSVPPSDTYDYVFKTPGNYTYKVRGTNLVGSIIIE